MPSGYVLRAGEAAAVARKAVLTSDLELSPFAGVAYADPRLVDPHLHELVEEAREQARREGYEQGKAAGYADGVTEGLAAMERERAALAFVAEAQRADFHDQMTQLRLSTQEAVSAALDYQLPLIGDLRDLVAGLAVDIAEELAGHHLRVGDCAALDAVRRVLESIPREVLVTLYLNPRDAARVEEYLASLPGPGTFTVVADDSVAPGDALARAENLEVESCLDDALAAVRKVLHP